MFIYAALVIGALNCIPLWFLLCRDAETPWQMTWRFFGLVFVTISFISSLVLAFVPVHGQRIMHLDHKECQSYQWLDGDWKCVPWEEAG